MSYKAPNELSKLFVKAMALKHAIPFHAEIAGSIRREESTVNDIDLVVITPDPDDDDHPEWWAVTILHDLEIAVTEGANRRATGIKDGTQINLWTCKPEEFGAMLFYATGPKHYNIAYRSKAKKLGLRLNEKGLFDEGGDYVAGAAECDIYAALGKQWKEPKLRGKNIITSTGKGVVHGDR